MKHSNIIYEKSRFFHAWSTWSNVQEMCIKDFIFVQGIFREKPLRFFLFLNQPIIFPYPSRMHNKYYLIILEKRNSQSIPRTLYQYYEYGTYISWYQIYRISPHKYLPMVCKWRQPKVCIRTHSCNISWSILS